jgi:hypothetical protein
VDYHWYEWVKFWDGEAKFPEPREVLGRWLGPSLDVGPAMTAKIIKSNGKVMHLSSYRKLNPEELVDEEETQKRTLFTKLITTRLGAPMTLDDLTALDIEANTRSTSYMTTTSMGSVNESLTLTT